MPSALLLDRIEGEMEGLLLLADMDLSEEAFAAASADFEELAAMRDFLEAAQEGRAGTVEGEG